MTDGSKKRAVVLGGGGPVGVGWELGIAAGLVASGVDLAEADLVIGTSAGSLTGALLMSGEDPTQLVDDAVDMFARGVGESGVDRVEMGSLAGLLEMMLGPAGSDGPEGDDTTRLIQVGRISMETETIAEEAFVGSLATTL